jgi:hypothetical protein
VNATIKRELTKKEDNDVQETQPGQLKVVTGIFA